MNFEALDEAHVTTPLSPAYAILTKVAGLTCCIGWGFTHSNVSNIGFAVPAFRIESASGGPQPTRVALLAQRPLGLDLLHSRSQPVQRLQ
jgi:hypothetical protein